MWYSPGLVGECIGRERTDSRVAAIETTVAAIKELGGRARTFHANVRGTTWLEERFDDPGGADDPVFILEVDFVEIGDRRVTVADLEHLKALEHLKFLVLTGSSVNDTHLENLLENLNEFATLQILSLIGMKVTDAGVENLQKALPNCKIQRFP